jgi:hypothetical protein
MATAGLSNPAGRSNTATRERSSNSCGLCDIHTLVPMNATPATAGPTGESRVSTSRVSSTPAAASAAKPPIRRRSNRPVPTETSFIPYPDSAHTAGARTSARTSDQR